MIWSPHETLATTLRFVQSCIEASKGGSRLAYVITDVINEKGADAAIGMPEAIGAVADVALASAEIFRVQVSCDVENLPSQCALEKAGFTREGRLERFIVHPNISPEPRACFMYARVR